MGTEFLVGDKKVGKLVDDNFECFLCGYKVGQCHMSKVIEHYRGEHSKQGLNKLIIAPQKG